VVSRNRGAEGSEGGCGGGGKRKVWWGWGGSEVVGPRVKELCSFLRVIPSFWGGSLSKK